MTLFVLQFAAKFKRIDAIIERREVFLSESDEINHFSLRGGVGLSSSSSSLSSSLRHPFLWSSFLPPFLSSLLPSCLPSFLPSSSSFSGSFFSSPLWSSSSSSFSSSGPDGTLAHITIITTYWGLNNANHWYCQFINDGFYASPLPGFAPWALRNFQQDLLMRGPILSCKIKGSFQKVLFKNSWIGEFWFKIFYIFEITAHPWPNYTNTSFPFICPLSNLALEIKSPFAP